MLMWGEAGGVEGAWRGGVAAGICAESRSMQKEGAPKIKWTYMSGQYIYRVYNLWHIHGEICKNLHPTAHCILFIRPWLWLLLAQLAVQLKKLPAMGLMAFTSLAAELWTTGKWDWIFFFFFFFLFFPTNGAFKLFCHEILFLLCNFGNSSLTKNGWD